MNEVVVVLLRHKTWATVRLIEACQRLDNATLRATTPGTYGTIPDTLQHLVAADLSYLRTVTGDWPAPPLPDQPVSLATLAGLTRQLADHWEAVAQDVAIASSQATTTDGWTTPAAVPIAQAIHPPRITAATSCPSSALAASRSRAWISARTWTSGTTASQWG